MTCAECGSASLTQDPDVLDTWFSSQLWPFSTLGWPDETPDLETFYPTSLMVTGYEILYLWVARMIFSGLYFMKDVPFHDVLIHGIVRDKTGKKMSKSLGNVIDPLDLIENFGADALRFSLASSATSGNDVNFSEDRIEGARNFANKLWNAARFTIISLGDERPGLPGIGRPRGRGPLDPVPSRTRRSASTTAISRATTSPRRCGRCISSSGPSTATGTSSWRRCGCRPKGRRL